MLDLFTCNSFQDVPHPAPHPVPQKGALHVGSGSSRRVSLLLGLLLLQSGLVAAPARAVPIISELFYDAVGTDNGQSFVELAGVPGSSLDGMTLEGINGSGGTVTVVIDLWGEIPEDGLFVLGDHDADGLSLVSEADQLANFDFQNGPDSVVLRHGDEILDAVGYGDFDPGEVFAGEGLPAPDGPAGSSLARLFADVDTGDNFADFAILDTPTPGFAEYEALPEPGSGLLLAVSLGALWVMGRRREVSPE
jgi:hypothetical protein